jgi:hypothetical protein
METVFRALQEVLVRHWMSGLLLGLTLATFLGALLFRWWVRRRWQHLLEEDAEAAQELDILPPLSAADRNALELIKQLRREIWTLPESDLRLGVEAMTERALAVVRRIASVYHPAGDHPEYEATLLGSLHLARRVLVRISHIASASPWKLLGNRKLSEYQRFYQVVRMINDSPVLQLLRNHRHLYRAARWAMNLKNLGNPLYWAGKEVSREGYFLMLRWFYVAFVSQVGREAMKLYGGRHYQREEERDAAVLCHRLFALTRQWGGPDPAEWQVLLEVVTGHASLDADMKVRILSRWSTKRLPAGIEGQPLQTPSARNAYRRSLKKLLESGRDGPPTKQEWIDREWAALAREEAEWATGGSSGTSEE